MAVFCVSYGFGVGMRMWLSNINSTGLLGKGFTYFECSKKWTKFNEFIYPESVTLKADPVEA